MAWSPIRDTACRCLAILSSARPAEVFDTTGGNKGESLHEPDSVEARSSVVEMVANIERISMGIGVFERRVTSKIRRTACSWTSTRQQMRPRTQSSQYSFSFRAEASMTIPTPISMELGSLRRVQTASSSLPSTTA